MKYAFIDYENLNSLDGLELQKYDHVFLFLGSADNQAHIHITEKFTDEINITLVKVKDVAKNNVDFHLSYYLGKQDEKAEKTIEFHVISNDKGYDGVCDFISNQKERRKCLRCEVKRNEPSKNKISKSNTNIQNNEVSQLAEKYKLFLEKIKNKPTSKTALQNSIHNYYFKNTDKQNAMNKINEIINILISEKFIEITNSTVNYTSTSNTIISSDIDSEKTKEGKIKLAVERYKEHLKNAKKEYYPNNLTTLKNNVYNQTNLKELEYSEAESMVSEVINKLRDAKVLNINDKKVTYP